MGAGGSRRQNIKDNTDNTERQRTCVEAWCEGPQIEQRRGAEGCAVRYLGMAEHSQPAEPDLPFGCDDGLQRILLALLHGTGAASAIRR